MKLLGFGMLVLGCVLICIISNDWHIGVAVFMAITGACILVLEIIQDPVKELRR